MWVGQSGQMGPYPGMPSVSLVLSAQCSVATYSQCFIDEANCTLTSEIGSLKPRPTMQFFCNHGKISL